MSLLVKVNKVWKRPDFVVSGRKILKKLIDKLFLCLPIQKDGQNHEKDVGNPNGDNDRNAYCDCRNSGYFRNKDIDKSQYYSQQKVNSSTTSDLPRGYCNTY
jgi:hypothetical protein